MTGQVNLTGPQSARLAEFLSDNADGNEVTITVQGTGEAVFAGSLAVWTVNEEGEVDEA